MIAYRSSESVYEPITPECTQFKEDLISIDGNYLFPNYAVLNNIFSAYDEVGISPFKKYDNSPELYSNVRIGNFVVDCFGLFANCKNFNKPVFLGNSIMNYSCMFSSCTNFNQPIIFNSYGNNFSSALASCSSFNATVEFSAGASMLSNNLNLSGMFVYDQYFNTPFDIPNNSVDLSGLFYGCVMFNQNIIIPESVTDCSSMLCLAYNYSSHIYFKGNSSRVITAYGMLEYAGSISYTSGKNLPKYIHCHKNIAPILYSGNIWGSVSWTALSGGNGWYNSAYNIYLYNNYSG